MRLGTGELLVVLVIVILIFGAKRIPQLAEGLGKGIRAFKKSATGEDEVAAAARAEPAALETHGEAGPLPEARAQAEVRSR